jgi:hypothetical protein
VKQDPLDVVSFQTRGQCPEKGMLATVKQPMYGARKAASLEILYPVSPIGPRPEAVFFASLSPLCPI